MNNITCERRIYNKELSIHSHSFAQLILPLEGILDIETDHKKLMLDTKHLFFLPPDCVHSFKANNTNEFLVMDIPHNLVGNCSRHNIQGGSKFIFDDRWKAVRFLLLSEIGKANNSSAINSLFHYFYQFILNDNTPDSIKYINKHFTENIDLQTLADIEHYNAGYYSEWFKKNMSVSPKEYIQKLRIDKAKQLLLDTNFNILQISHIVGYSHNSTLTRVFKSFEGITPAQFRQQFRK